MNVTFLRFYHLETKTGTFTSPINVLQRKFINVFIFCPLSKMLSTRSPHLTRVICAFCSISVPEGYEMACLCRKNLLIFQILSITPLLKYCFRQVFIRTLFYFFLLGIWLQHPHRGISITVEENQCFYLICWKLYWQKTTHTHKKV